MYPKGKIIVIGHSVITENRNKEKFAFRKEENNKVFEFLPNKKEDRIEIISSFPINSDNFSEIYSAELLQRGYYNFGVIYSEKLSDYENDYYLRIFKAKTVILIGNQFETTSLFTYNSISELIHKRFIEDESFTMVGINNSAAILTDLMIGCKSIEKGLGFIKGCIISTPQDHRTGFKTLAKAVLSHQNDLGLSVCGGMSVIIEKGFQALCKGNGSAMIVNAKEVSAKSIKPFKRGVSVYVKNLKGHILVDSCAVDLLTGERIKPQIFDYSLNFMNTNNIN